MGTETFGQALRRLRGGRSVRDVASLANCGKSTVSDLEHGKKWPTPEVAAALDQALGANGELMALASIRPGMSPLDRADALQHSLGETLASGPMTDAALEDWEFTVARHGRATRYRPEADLLEELLGDFADLQQVASHRHSAPARRRLMRAVAQMSGLMALTLLKLGDPRASAWWRTGRQAAATVDDRETLSWIYAHEAYQRYYAGDMYGAVEAAVRAQDIAGGLPCVGPALAAPLEARAHATLGNTEGTHAALHRAGEALDRLDPADRVASAFGYSESQLAFHSGNAWTHLRQTGRAREEHEHALELYPTTDRTDRALIRLDQAACLVADGTPDAGAAHAARAIADLPDEHRSPLIIYRAREVAATVPEGRQAPPEAMALRSLLELPSGV